MTPTELKAYVQKHNIKMIDAKFVDFLGQWKHLTYPIERLDEGFEEGFGFMPLGYKRSGFGPRSSRYRLTAKFTGRIQAPCSMVPLIRGLNGNADDADDRVETAAAPATVCG